MFFKCTWQKLSLRFLNTLFIAALLVLLSSGTLLASDPIHFVERTALEVERPQGAYLADIDNDGDNDIVTSSEQAIGGLNLDPVVSWLENDNSDGASWTEHQVSSFPLDMFEEVPDIAIADIDDDGDQDIVAGVEFPGRLYWFENTSNGATWTQHLIATLNVRPRELEIADIDGDGNLDIVQSGMDDDPEGAVIWWDNTNGDGSTWTRRSVRENFAQFASAMTVADLDGDGDNDIIASFTDFDPMDPINTSHNSWWENLGTDPVTWTERSISTTYSNRSVAAIDLDGDSDLDLLKAPNRAGFPIIWLENVNGDGQTLTEHTLAATTPDIIAVRAIDIDGDNDADVVGGGDALVWYENNGSGGGWTSATVADSDLIDFVALGQVDQDADNDIVGVYDGSFEGLALWDNRRIFPSATFPTRINVATGLDNQVFSSLADINGDGDIDFIAARPRGDKLRWYESDGTLHSIADGTEVVDAVGVDLDNDGDTDVLAAARTLNQVVWWENTNGIGTNWTFHTIASSFTGAAAVGAVDIDGDNDLDVVAAAGFGDEIAWFRNDSGTWSTANSIETAFDGAGSITLADVDGDGDVDVLSTAANDNEVTWFENNGTGTSWTTHTIATSFFGASSAVAADIDCDGDLDVIATAPGGNGLAWWENLNGDGLNWTKRTVELLNGVRSVAAADVDQDGNVDLVAGSRTAKQIAWWRNDNGNGLTWTKTTVHSNFNAYEVFVGPIDGDAEIDLGGGSANGRLDYWPNGG